MVGAFAQVNQEPPLQSPATVADSMMNYSKESIDGDSVLRNSYSTDNVIQKRTFPKNFKRKYRGEDFSYETIKPKESFWSRIERKLKKFLQSVFGEANPKTSARLINAFLWLLAIAALAVALYYTLNYLASRQGNFMFGRKNRKISIEDKDVVENIHEINFAESIIKFEREKNYRYAVRYQFLQVLKKLTDKNIIDWNPEKTNRDYLSELQNDNLKKHFRELVHIFDYVWYGEFEIDEASYANFREKFTAVKSS